jgi:hypothetical protein
MDAKLTLTIEQEIIRLAKQYAHAKGRSLSDLVENYLKIIVSESKPEEIQLPPLVKSLKGSIHVPENFDYKSALSDSLANRYDL